TFQCSCLNGYPENSNNLGYALLKRGAIATNSATRVSWYYPGQTIFTNTDSNAGMAYKYAQKLVRDHLPCGDAHYQMMVEVPNEIWMNHCVFNLYGDPSLAYAAGPTVSHTPYYDTDNTSQPYVIEANVVSNGPLKQGSPTLRWNTNGGTSFSNSQMSLVGGVTYRGQIPPQPYGTTVYYYIYAEDSANRSGISPAGAPEVLHTFRVRVDSQPPTIRHTPLSDTGDTIGPYTVRAEVTDNTGIASVTLYYHRNSGPDTMVIMNQVGAGLYEGQIPGPSFAGDVISYYITAVDSSLSRNSARAPSPTGYYSFTIPPKRRVAVLNTTAIPPYFIGSNSNAYQQVVDILNSDPARRFEVTILTSLAGRLAGQDALVLPDNGVLSADTQAVMDWFTPGKTILTLDSSTSYAACSGLMWPQAAGTNGFGTCWDTNAAQNDQEIVLDDPITSGYTLGQVIESRGYTASFITSSLPSDARVLSISKTNPGRAYAVYRDVPGKGRIVALGPYIPIQQGQYSMIREALSVSPADKQLAITAPTSGSVFEVGDIINIQYRTSGAWAPVDRIKLEYTTGLDETWRPIPGAQLLSPGIRSFAWNTAGLPGSDCYKVRASLVGGSLTKTSGVFTIAPVVSIAQAKSVPDGGVVKLKDKVVTCNTGGIRYIQEPTRLAGIRLNSPLPMAVSALVTVVGKVGTVNGERVINASDTQVTGTSTQVAPLFMKTSALGGGAFGGQQAVMEYRRVRSGQTWSTMLLPAPGLNNIGLFVKIAGVVTGVGPDYFYVNDGSNCNDGSGMLGVRVICPNIAKPSIGSRVSVAGISSTYFDRRCLWRAILLPSQNELQTL
ncbi:MAG: C25 family cysteine peptidase, partial [Armatimonadetes bacterium]|nr:C25 family cysteine peptidase [Armatimonadota bacterium]